MIVFVCSLIGFILFIFGSTWYAATTRGGTGFICYQSRTPALTRMML